MEYLFIYLLQVIETLNIISLIFTILFGFGFIFLLIGSIRAYIDDAYADEMKKLTNLLKYVGIGLILSIPLLFAPTKQTVTLMGGVYMGKQVIESEIAQKSYKVIELQLDKILKELTNER